MRVFNSVGIAVACCIFLYCYYFIEVLDNLYSSAWMYRNGSFVTGSLNATLNAAFIMLLISLFFIVFYGANLKQIPRVTTKILGITGVCVAILFFILNIGIIAANGDVFFGITLLVSIIFGLVNLAFAIVLLVQSVLHHKRPKLIQDEPDVLHSVEIDFEVE